MSVQIQELQLGGTEKTTQEQAAEIEDQADDSVQPQPGSSLAETQPDPALFMKLLTVSSRLAVIVDIEVLIRELLPMIVPTLPMVQGGMLWLYERRIGKLRLAATHGFPIESSVLAALDGLHIGSGELLAGQAFQNREITCIEGRTGYATRSETLTTGNKTLFQQLVEHLPRRLSVICVPLIADQEAVGVLELMNLSQPPGNGVCDKDSVPEPEPGTALRHDPEPERNGDQDYPTCVLSNPFCIEMLQTFASLIAAKIRNTRLYAESQRQCHRLSAFDAVVTAISAATDLHDLMEGVLNVVLGFLPVSSGAILLFDPTQDRLTLGAHQRLPPTYAESLKSFPVTGAACEEVIHYGQPMLRPLMEERGEAPLLENGLESCAYLPLLAGGTVVGALGLYGDSMLPREIDISTLMPLSNQVGFAIANVHLYEVSQLERQKLNTVINSTAEGVMLCNGEGRLVLANEAAMGLLKLDAIPYAQALDDMPDFYKMCDLEGQPLPVERLPIARALDGEVFHDYRVLMEGASGANTVMSFSGAPAYANEGKTIEGAVIIFRDITARQRLERAKDEFLAVAAHELRSPLASVRSYADMLIKREKQRADEHGSRDLRGLTILSQQVTHMLRMVDNLLNVSKLDAGQIDLQLQPINLVSLASQVLDLKRPEAGNRELVLDTDLPDITVQADSMRIRQVLTNLVGNAIKYSPQETRVTVSLAIVETDGQREALVAVDDEGSGIPPEQQSKLFQRYSRVSKNRRRIEGLGLGLYISRKFVQLHGGRIWTESVEGEGSTFYFTLPIRASEE